MDAFRQAQAAKVGIGGIGCYCCNRHCGKGSGHRSKRTLTKIARARLRAQARDEVKDALSTPQE